MQPQKYVIRLTGKEKRELRTLKRKGKTEARLADRARIILWAHNGVTAEATAKRLDCGREKVFFWRRRFLEGRATKQPVLERLRDQPRPGRPPVFSPSGAGDDCPGDAGLLSNCGGDRPHGLYQS